MQVPRTLDNTREVDETVVQPDDEEVLKDEVEDEFQPYFSGERTPKLFITTRPRPSKELFHFVGDLMQMIPNAFFYPRRSFEVKEICRQAQEGGFTHVCILSEKSKVCNGLLVSHLPDGPTAFFKVTNVVPGARIAGHGQPTSHIPELILNNFHTRLGHRIGRFLGALFPHNPEFKGRQVVTFHNQRDFLFVRHHRYIFDEKKPTSKAAAAAAAEKGRKKKRKGAKGAPGSTAASASEGGTVRARLQELGPRFTLKLRWLQEGTFDTQFGEYEWVHKRKEMDTTRRRFHL
jgi:ribosome production factor 1